MQLEAVHDIAALYISSVLCYLEITLVLIRQIAWAALLSPLPCTDKPSSWEGEAHISYAQGVWGKRGRDAFFLHYNISDQGTGCCLLSKPRAQPQSHPLRQQWDLFQSSLNTVQALPWRRRPDTTCAVMPQRHVALMMLQRPWAAKSKITWSLGAPEGRWVRGDAAGGALLLATALQHGLKFCGRALATGAGWQS